MLSLPTSGIFVGCNTNTTEMLYGTECRFSCKEGSVATGSMGRRCTENGNWTGTDLECTGIRSGNTLNHEKFKIIIVIIRESYPLIRLAILIIAQFKVFQNFLWLAQLCSIFCDVCAAHLTKSINHRSSMTIVKRNIITWPSWITSRYRFVHSTYARNHFRSL